MSGHITSVQCITSVQRVYPDVPLFRKALLADNDMLDPDGNSGSGDRAQTMSSLFVRVNFSRDFCILKTI
jgi:hypothetical protein